MAPAKSTANQDHFLEFFTRTKERSGTAAVKSRFENPQKAREHGIETIYQGLGPG